LWALAGAGGAYQLVAAATFVQALQPASRARAFGLAQSGLYAVQGLGILAGLIGLTAAAMLAATWAQLHTATTQAEQAEAVASG